MFTCGLLRFIVELMVDCCWNGKFAVEQLEFVGFSRLSKGDQSTDGLFLHEGDD